MSIVFCRVEERLIHGQITVAWSNSIEFDAFLIVDNQVAHDEFMKSILEMSAPISKKMYIFDENEAIEKIEQLNEKLFILAKSPITFANLKKHKIAISHLNIGSVHFKPGKQEIYKTVCLSKEEIDALVYLMKENVICYIQKLPTEGKKNVADLI